MNERTQIQPKTETPSFSPSPSLAPRTNLLQRKCACGGTPGIDGECAECRKKRLQRRSIGQAGPSTVPSIVPDVLRSPGEPLDAAARAFMEPRFGHDFSQVRIHTDAKAAESAQVVNAVAYTVGSSIVFGRGQFAPQTAKGRRLLAHELAHTVQQQGVRGEAQDIGLDLTAQSLERSLEREADTHAERVVAGRAAEPGQLQKQLGVARLQRLGDPAQAPAGMACPIAQSSAGGIGSDIFFGSAGRTLTPSQQADIAAFVSNWHDSGADAAVRIDGYASVEGTQTFNWQLSCDRAVEVAAEMVTPSAPGAGAGIPSSFITIFAQGETTEFSTTAPDPNRRVVISITFPAPPAPVPAPVVAPAGRATLNFLPVIHDQIPRGWGVTVEDAPIIDITAYASGGVWKSVITTADQQARQGVHLLGRVEVTPALVASEADCGRLQTMITSLNSVANQGADSGFYMLSAVQAHENVHITQYRADLAPHYITLKTAVEALTVPLASHANAAAAKAAIKALPAYTVAIATFHAAHVAAQNATASHPSSAPFNTAEHGVVDPMITTIRTRRTALTCPP